MTQISWPDAEEVCLVTAVDVEFNAAVSLLTSHHLSTEFQIKTCRGRIGRRRITVLQCGMGARGFAEALSNHLKNNRYEALLVAGLAGGLDPRLKSGDAVIYLRCFNARLKEKPPSRDQNASIHSNNELSIFLSSALRSRASNRRGQQCFEGAGLTVDRIITEAKTKILLGSDYCALAVDMESYDVLSVCAASNLPAAVLRIISDEAGEDLPDFNRAANADGGMSIWRTAAVMAARPAASYRFLRSIGTVVKSLRESLQVVLNA
ncbi:MAG TPA: hypothetical protein PLD20_09900 [Blastocatellia bacterium]|nr:hypothetical protein [Blastocatellia bacterium]HMX24027.1 hypothetical protein [Blastocatellia bacterium]HMY70551.1 hypothetical protein [Blastocatellia bacterium]HMZ18233.1 hypothetical protein [Blastocatellia bacterium]HNG29353.1 hypothetical protein [Blastocatellia bacterium]